MYNYVKINPNIIFNYNSLIKKKEEKCLQGTGSHRMPLEQSVSWGRRQVHKRREGIESEGFGVQNRRLKFPLKTVLSVRMLKVENCRCWGTQFSSILNYFDLHLSKSTKEDCMTEANKSQT